MQCFFCEAPVDSAHRFCAQCGVPLPGAAPSDAGKRQAILQGDVDINALTRLREEKQRLSDDLYEIMEITKDGRELSPHERRVARELYAKWKRVSQEVTARVDYFCERLDADRRQDDRRSSDRRRQQVAIGVDDRRSGAERRASERRAGADRRDPFRPLVADG